MRKKSNDRSSWPDFILIPLTLVLSLILYAAPSRIPTGPHVSLLLPLITLFIWSVRTPTLTPPWLIFLTGVAQDLLSGGPMGVWALAYLIAFSIARPRQVEGGIEFMTVMGRFLMVGAIALGIAALAGAAAVGAPTGITALITDGVLTIILFPVFAWLFARRKERTSFF